MHRDRGGPVASTVDALNQRETMADDLTSRIGPEGSPLHRIKATKEEKLAIQQVLAGKQYAPQIRLRGYLAIGRVPSNELITEENIVQALRPEDSLGCLHLTARRIPFLDIEIPLAAVSKELARGTDANPERLAIKLAQFANRWDSLRARPRLTDGSVYQFIELVGELAERTATRRRVEKRPRNAKKRKNPFGPLIKFVIRLAKESEMRSRLSAVKVVAALHRARIMDIEEQLGTDTDFTAALGHVWKKAVLDVEGMGIEGKTSEFEQWATTLRDLPFNREETQSTFEAWNRDASRFPPSTQPILKNLLGIAPAGVGYLELTVDQSAAVQTTQLASILLQLWDARDEGPKAREAFAQLQSVLEGFFGIRLGGTVGDVENYNPRIHEMSYGDKKTATVKLLRPWVELSHHGRADIIVRAVVKSQT